MCIDDEITLNGIIEEVISWLEETRRKCRPGGSWWDAIHNRPEIGGIYVKIEYDCNKLCWVLDDSGVYDMPLIVHQHEQFIEVGVEKDIATAD